MDNIQSFRLAGALLGVFCLMPISVFADENAVVISSNNVVDSSSQTPLANYDLGFREVLNQALDISYEYKALNYELRSTEILKDKEESYFYPTATLSSEQKEYYGEPRPDPDSTGKAILTLRAKVWGSSTDDRIDASENNRLSGEMNLKGKELEIYYVVLKYLTKVELTREFKRQTDEIRVELENFYQKQLNATEAGVSTQSDAMEVELTKSRFEEQVFAVVSNIDRYFRDLRIETGLELGSQEQTQRIGIDYNKLVSVLDINVTKFDSHALIRDNYGLRSTEYLLKATLQSAKAQRERLKIDLVNETHVALYGGNDQYEWGDTDDSYFGLNVTYDLYNHGIGADQESALELYKAEKERYDMGVQKFLAQLDATALDYENTMAKRNNLIEQLRINRELIENQKNEIYTDKVTYLDIAESISSLNQSEIALLNMELSLYDQLYELMELKSQKIY
ncbi:TolC family protein [Vibrio rhodolitus]|uniref:TolC family protein n=1 Tax=Vibrio rhodolitus TaxID=2231649 RepID=UPI000E0AECB3|nr:TolC family protein [Vibrio rhodolitus]